MRYLVGRAVVAWLAVGARGGAGDQPSASPPPQAVEAASIDDCHCLIPANHGLYR